MNKQIMLFCIATICLFPIGLVITADDTNPDDDPLYALQREYGSLHGTVLDAETGMPVLFANVRLKDTGRYRISRDDGTFQFDGIPARHYTITVQHIGFVPVEKVVQVPANDTVHVLINLIPSVFQISESIVVTGTGRERGVSETYQPTSVIGGLELQRRMQTTLAQSISHLPGIAHQSFGAAATQPVIRGMGGDRVLVLEDGHRTGDVSTMSADHAVSIEPVTAERVEVVRGPAGLLYGNNALGGIINVIRNEIPRSLPDRISGSALIRGETYNQGMAGGGVIKAPLGNFSLRGEVSGRTANDIRTPQGTLPSTDLRGYNASLGISRITDWGSIGASVRQYEMQYGVPGEFNDQQIPGAHLGGVDIEFIRRVGRINAIHYDGFWWFSDIEFDGHLTHYILKEFEGETAEGRPIIGAEFDQLSASATLVARHVHADDTHRRDIRTEGAAGISFRYRDLLSVRGFTGTRSATEMVASVFAYEEFAWRSIRFQAGLRYDWTSIEPYDTRPITSGERLIPVTSRRFNAFSGSIALLYDFVPGWRIGISTARAFRNPAIEELYSDGPHLADFSFNIGNPELDEEIGTGIDIFLRGDTPRWRTDINLFYNFVANYIYYKPTGERDPRLRRYPVFQATSANAVFLGAEGTLQWNPMENVVLDGTMSYVHATRTIDNDPLPFIPPLNGNVTLRYEGQSLFASIGWTAAAAQNRVPSPIPDPLNEGEMLRPQSKTPAYNLVNMAIGYRWFQYPLLHTITLSLENATDQVWRDHLSRVKDIAPQPGRNLQLSYQVFF